MIPVLEGVAKSGKPLLLLLKMLKAKPWQL
jgi:hypothetical protein